MPSIHIAVPPTELYRLGYRGASVLVAFEYHDDGSPCSGFTVTRYEYVGLDGQRKRIPSFDNEAREVWAGHTTVFQTEEEGFPQQGIFVGTAAEYAKAGMMPY